MAGIRQPLVDFSRKFLVILFVVMVRCVYCGAYDITHRLSRPAISLRTAAPGRPNDIHVRRAHRLLATQESRHVPTWQDELRPAGRQPWATAGMKITQKSPWLKT